MARARTRPTRTRSSSSSSRAPKSGDLKAAMGRRFGPLPAWAYLATFAAAVWFWRQYQARKQAAAQAATQAPVSITYGTQQLPGVDTTGSSSGGGSGSGTGGDGGPPPTGPPPPPPQSFSNTIWIHGNPGHTYTYTGDPSVAAWFQIGGQWYYYNPGQTPKGYPGSAYAADDPGLPPGAGSPPSSSSSPGAQAPAQVNGQNVTQTVKQAQDSANVVGVHTLHHHPGGITLGPGHTRRPIPKLVRTRPVHPGPGGPHWTPPPFRPPPPPPQPKSSAAGSDTTLGRTRFHPTATRQPTATGQVGRPRPPAAYDPSQAPSVASPSRTVAPSTTASGPAPFSRAAGEHAAGAVSRAQARTAEASRSSTSTARTSGTSGSAGRVRQAQGGVPRTGRTVAPAPSKTGPVTAR